jgi:hypothetical protein
MQTRLSDLTYDQRLVKAAEDIIESGSCTVAKPVRAGFTTSAILACEKNGWHLLVLAPTNRILKETVSKASGTAIRVPGNSECQKLQQEISDNPVLKQLPLPLPECDLCELRNRCKLLEIIRVRDYSTAGLTYAKLEALMLSKGKRSEDVLKKLAMAEVVLLDEAHIMSLPSATRVKISEKVKIPTGYKALSGVLRTWRDLCQNLDKIAQDLMSRAAQGHASQHLAQTVTNPRQLEWDRLKSSWGQLRDLATKQEAAQETVLRLRDIITILGSSEITVSYISEDEGRSGSIYISSGQDRLSRALNEFLQSHGRRAKHIYVSGTMIEAHEGYLSEISGQDVKSAVFPDLRNATKKMVLIPDRWKLTSWNFDRKLEHIVSTIKAIAEREDQPIYLLASSAQRARVLKEEVDKLGLGNITVDYYRSDRSIGVERSERVCVSVGMAEIPANACDALAKGDNPEERWLHSRILRRQSVDTATWQAVNRVRDPEGKVESRVYFIGCRLEQVRQVALWGTNRQVVVKDIKETRGSDGNIIRTPVMDVQVDLAIETPRMFTEDLNRDRASRRKVSDFIGRIDQPHIPSTDIYRANVRLVEIYNHPGNGDQVETTIIGLLNLFVNRSDCYAQQTQNPRSKRWEYLKVTEPLDQEVLRRRVTGEITIGAYQISPDDQVTWCCDDIDSHQGETDAQERVKKVVAVLREYGIPFLLEASGSPDSYHIWIFLAGTRTYNAYRFIRQVNTEAEVKCEAWPKQKTLKSYGNLVKLPICRNLKTGNRSVFLDPDTFEELEGAIGHPGIVHLLEIPDSKSQGMPRIKSRRVTGVATDLGGSLAPCMLRALEDRVALVGAEGHNLRMAIAVKARSIGMTPEETATLFQHQPNYDYDLSLTKAEDLTKAEEAWNYDYQPWSCETLQDRCGGIVRKYCKTCPYAQGVEEEANNQAEA